MRRVAAFVLTSALYLQSIVPAFASPGGADTPACRPSKQMNSPSPQGTVGYTDDNAARVYQILETNGPTTTYAYDDAGRVESISKFSETTDFTVE